MSGDEIPKNVVDAAFVQLPNEAPWTVHAEIELRGRVDEADVRRAAQATMQEHPLLNARNGSSGATWRLVPDGPVPVTVVDCSPDDLDGLRGRLVSRPFDLQREAPVRFTLVRGGPADRLLVVADHALVDGVGIRLVATSLLNGLQGDSAAAPDTTWQAAHALRVSSPPAERVAATIQAMRAGMRPTAVRLVRVHTSETPGYGVVYGALGTTEAALLRAPGEGATTNDVILAAFALAGMAWNRAAGAPDVPFSIGVPINLRQPRSWMTGVCNATLSWPIRFETSDPGEVLQEVSRQMRPVRAGIYSTDVRAILAYLAGRSTLPHWLRHFLATSTVVSSVPFAASMSTPLACSFHGGAPASAASGVSFSVSDHADGFALAARYLHSHFTSTAVETIFEELAAAIRALCPAHQPLAKHSI